MTQATEQALKDLIEKYLDKHRLYETVYIKIVDNTVKIGTSIDDVESHRPYPRGQKEGELYV